MQIYILILATFYIGHTLYGMDQGFSLPHKKHYDQYTLCKILTNDNQIITLGQEHFKVLNQSSIDTLDETRKEIIPLPFLSYQEGVMLLEWITNNHPIDKSISFENKFNLLRIIDALDYVKQIAKNRLAKHLGLTI